MDYDDEMEKYLNRRDEIVAKVRRTPKGRQQLLKAVIPALRTWTGWALHRRDPERTEIRDFNEEHYQRCLDEMDPSGAVHLIEGVLAEMDENERSTDVAIEVRKTIDEFLAEVRRLSRSGRKRLRHCNLC